jgi:hypothetical protein
VILDILRLLAANLCFLLAGVGVVRLLAGARPCDWATFGLAYVAGVAALGVCSTFLLVAGLGLTVPEVLALCGALFVAGLVRRRPTRAFRGPSMRSASFVRLAASVVASFLVLLAIDFVFQPLFQADAYADWILKAREIVVAGGLSPEFWASPGFNTSSDYPLLVPAINAIDFRFMGLDTQVIHLQHLLLLAGFAAGLVALWRDRVPVVILWCGVAAILLAPTVAIQTGSALADVPIAIFLALAALCAWRWLADGEAGDLCLLALFSVAALSAKAEGLVFTVALFLALVPLVARHSWRRAGLTVVAAGVALLTLVPWRLWVSHHDIPGFIGVRRAFSPDFLASHTGYVRPTVESLLREIFDPRSWLLLVPAALVAAAIGLRWGRRREGSVLALGVFGLCFLGMVLIYWSTYQDINFLLGRSASRVVTSPVLMLAALAPLSLASALEGRSALSLTEPPRRLRPPARVHAAARPAPAGREPEVPVSQ